MTVTALYALTDKLAKTDSTMFADADKLVHFNIAKDLLYEIVTRNQEDRNEEEDTKATVASQAEYQEKARIHHVNWLKVNYGDGFLPARYKNEQSLVAEYGSELETVLSQWSQSDPIYYYKGKHLFIRPAPSAAQAGSDRLKVSLELYPPDLSAGSDVPELPLGYHYLLAVYAAWRYHDIMGEEAQAAKRAAELPREMTQPDVSALDPRARQAEIVSGVPDDDGSDF